MKSWQIRSISPVVMPGRDPRPDHVEHVGREAPGDAHGRLFGGGLDRDPGVALHQHGRSEGRAENRLSRCFDGTKMV